MVGRSSNGGGGRRGVPIRRRRHGGTATTSRSPRTGPSTSARWRAPRSVGRVVGGLLPASRSRGEHAGLKEAPKLIESGKQDQGRQPHAALLLLGGGGGTRGGSDARITESDARKKVDCLDHLQCVTPQLL
jgi:hypothetical protein